MSEPDRERFWDDGLHLTPDGYDLMGTKIAEGLIPLLAESLEPKKRAVPTQTRPNRTSRRRKIDPMDEVVWDEETGNPSVLSQGYVVVRQKDLD